MSFGLNPFWVEIQPECEMVPWIIAIGEARGGKFDYGARRWIEQPQAMDREVES